MAIFSANEIRTFWVEIGTYLVNLKMLGEIRSSPSTYLHNKSPNFIRTKDGYRITYVLVR